MRVLTFNSHQPYLHLLASALPWQLAVVEPRLPSGAVRCWDPAVRPVPTNVTLHASVARALDEGCCDWVLAHNVQDMIEVLRLGIPKLFLVHGTLSGRILQDGARIDRDRYVRDLERLLSAGGFRVAYISDLKRRDWGIPGEVIRPGIDADGYGGYRGDTRAVLQVANHMAARGAMLGWRAHQQVCRGLPAVLIGTNPGIAYSRRAESWEDLKEQYRMLRLYLHTATYPHEDGYNLAVLEAMATGMPVAALAHPTSPVIDGVNGIAAHSPEDLRDKVIGLLDRPEEAARLGREAARTVRREFSLGAFRESWLALAGRVRG